jgi:hypothetical protein
MGLLDLFCVAPTPRALHDDSTATFECDYDTGPTSLYQAIENKAWVPALEFFDTGRWQGLLSSGEDPLPPERQARTWVTRFESDGKVRWSQLPIHAALIFGAPFKVIATLVTLYPQGVRCVDDQHMLPLHLAVKFGAEDNVLRLLIEHFPEAICTSDIRGRLPSQIEGPRIDRTKIMNEVVNVNTRTLQKKFDLHLKEELSDLQDDLVLQSKLNAELESQKRELELQLKRLQTELVVLRDEVGSKSQSREQKEETLDRKSERILSPAEDENSAWPVKSFVFGKMMHSADKGMNHSSDSQSKSSGPKSRAETEKTLKSAETNTVSDRSASSSIARQSNPYGGTKKLRRRGFFKGFGARE